MSGAEKREFHDLGISELAAVLARKEASSVEVAKHFMARATAQ